MKMSLANLAFVGTLVLIQPHAHAQTPATISAASLGGAATESDTGAPLAGARVLAFPVPATSTQPIAYKAVVDTTGNYSLSVPAGQYRLCLRPPFRSLYLDPCQWGTAIAASVVSGVGTTTPLTAQRGVRFIVRVHDPQRLLPQAETVTGAAVSAYVTGASVPKFPLPVVLSDSNIRDYGTLIPINVPMTVTISSAKLVLNDKTGAPLATSPIAFTILPTDIEVVGNASAPPMFPPPDARIVHVYAASLR